MSERASAAFNGSTTDGTDSDNIAILAELGDDHPHILRGIVMTDCMKHHWPQNIQGVTQQSTTKYVGKNSKMICGSYEIGQDIVGDGSHRQQIL